MQKPGTHREPECRKMAGLVAALPDGELGPAARAAVEEHLDRCPSCRADARAVLQLGDVLRASTPEPALPSGREVATWVLEREAARARPVWRWPQLLAAPGLAAVVLILAAGLAGRPHRSATSFHPQAVEPLPALMVVDDERSGRQVLLAPPVSD